MVEVSLLVVVCVCVLRHAVKNVKNTCVDSKRLRVCIQNVSLYAGTTRTCVETFTRGACTHGDVLNVHTGTL